MSNGALPQTRAASSFNLDPSSSARSNGMRLTRGGRSPIGSNQLVRCAGSSCCWAASRPRFDLPRNVHEVSLKLLYRRCISPFKERPHLLGFLFRSKPQTHHADARPIWRRGLKVDGSVELVGCRRKYLIIYAGARKPLTRFANQPSIVEK